MRIAWWWIRGLQMSRRVTRGFSPKAFTAARLAMGISRGELGRLADLSIWTIRSWETGQATPSATTLRKAVQVLGVELPVVVRIDPADRLLGDLRVLAGLSQSELAQAAGMSTTSFAALERGELRIRPEHTSAIAAALGVAPEIVTAAYERAYTRPAYAAP